MGLAYHIDLDEHLVTVSAHESLQPGDMESLADTLIADPLFAADMAQLLDLRQAAINIHDEHARLLAGYLLKNYNPAIRGNIAVVIDPNLTPADTARMFRVTCALERAELFEDFDMAVKWLVRKWRAVSSDEKQPQTGD
jgi:hypothetical protein